MAGLTVREKERLTPIAGTYDVIVAGGGIAGVAAALSASRHGRKTLLIERMYGLGGLACLGLVTIYLPLCDGMGRQVCKGLNDEFLRLSISRGWEDKYPDTWMDGKKDHGSQRFEVGYNANVFSILLEQTLCNAGCHLLYGTAVVDVLKKGNLVRAVVVENVSGRSAFLAGSVVDATGDATVCQLAGVPTQVYPKGNALAAWFYETKGGKNLRHMLGAADVLPENNGQGKIPERLEGRRYSGLDARETTEMTIEAHARLLCRFLEDGGVSQSHSLSAIASIPELRMTRRIAALKTICEDDVHKEQRDSVGLINDWRRRGPVWEVPFSSLYHPQVPNLAAVGRCISATDGMWDVSRVIPSCVVTGQAAGTAFSLSPNLAELDPDCLGKVLRKDGVLLHEKEL
ncbi:MAG: FAD-dependent oxidoreductase [Spirochaetaceae bacterium]|nr:FAD-dependent oxidoreductase [Spirochaetaceae bacterium]